MKLYSAVVLPLLLATLACTPTGVHAAQDGGPQTGGTVSTNPNDRPQNGGPMSGSSTSTNPNGRPSAAADADGSTTGPPSIAPVTTAPITSTPVTSAPVPPPMSGGDLSTNPNRPSATSSASSSPMTMSPSATTEPPRLTSSAPSPQSLPTSDDASAGDDNAASWTPEPSHANAGDAIDFTLINDDGSGVTDIVGEVDAEDIEHIDLSSSRHDELPNNGTTTDGSGAVNEDGTANAADAYESNAAGASTPSPVSKTKISSAGLTSASSEPSSSFAAMATLFTMTVWVMFASA